MGYTVVTVVAVGYLGDFVGSRSGRDAFGGFGDGLDVVRRSLGRIVVVVFRFKSRSLHPVPSGRMGLDIGMEVSWRSSLHEQILKAHFK